MNILEVLQRARGFQLYSLSDSHSPVSASGSFDKAHAFPQRILIVPSLEKDYRLENEELRGSSMTAEKSSVGNTKLNLSHDSSNITAYNSRYRSSIKLIEDPCIYRIVGTGHSSNDDDKKSGMIDLCRNLVVVGQEKRMFRNVNGVFVFGSALEEYSEGKKKSMGGLEKKSPGEAVKGKQHHTLKVFVVNSYSRLKELKSEVVGETEKILRVVGQIFRNSGAPVRIRLTGVASLGKNIKMIDDDPDMLYAFRRVISPVRYNPRNLKYPLGDSDVVVFLTNDVEDGKRAAVKDEETVLRSKRDADPSKAKKKAATHGMSFYAGSSMLSRSYAVVFSSKDESRLFVAKKIAHELGHLLGCSHDTEGGYLMEARSCVGCEDVPRVFSKESLKAMTDFVRMNKEFFTGQLERQSESTQPVMSLEDARSFVASQRKHSFRDIVETRLNGIPPEGLCSLYYLLFSLCVYLVCISFAIYHFS